MEARPFVLKSRERKYLLFLEGPPYEDTEKFVQSNIDKGNPHFVAMVDDKVVGWCDILRHDRIGLRHCGHLGIGVLKAFRGRGIGTQLIESVKAKAFSEGLPVTLRVLKVNPARIWYERLGFVMAEERETHYYMKAMPT